MKSINTLSISLKLTIAFGLLVVVFAANVLVSLTQMSRMNRASDAITDDWMPSVVMMGDLRQEILEHRRFELAHILATGETDMARLKGEIDQSRQSIAKLMTAYGPLISDQEEQKIFDEMHHLLDGYFAVSDQVLQESGHGNKTQAQLVTEHNGRAAFRALDSALEREIDMNRKGSAQATETRTQSYATAKTVTWILLLVVIGLTLLLLALLRRAIAAPIITMTLSMKDLAAGNLTIAIPARDRRDEVGAMAEAVQVFKDNAIRANELAAEQQTARQAREIRAQRIESLTRGFEDGIIGVLNTVSGAASQMETTSQSMSANAEQTNRQAIIVAAAGEEASGSVETVAAAAEELSVSIREIGQQVVQSSRLAQTASDEASRTNATVQGLNESSARIGEVVNLINTIASQTNLLALNATIEAARAGEAGKGFAVVANEVKSLANQTAKATQEISTQIGAVQTATRDAVQAIGGIVSRINEINQIAAAISTAVEEQSAATAEIARNVQQAATGTQDVSQNIGGVTTAASETGAAAQQVLGAARSLSGEAAQLKNRVDQFLRDVRAA